MANDIMDRIDELYYMISEAYGVPLGKDKCMVERAAALSIIDDIRGMIPTEIAEAKRLMASRDEYVAEAKKEIDAMRLRAQEEADRMINEQEIMQIARARSEDIISSAERKASELRHAASEYIDDILSRSEETLTSSQRAISSARSTFRELASREAVAASVSAPDQEERKNG